MRKTATWGVVIAFALCGALLCSCEPSAERSASDRAPESNDVVIIGQLDGYDPDTESEHSEGESMGFDEESALQQEKTTGGAGGAVTSTNIQPMDPGITEYSEEDVPGFTPTDR